MLTRKFGRMLTCLIQILKGRVYPALEPGLTFHTVHGVLKTRANSLEKMLMLGKIEVRKRRG